MRITAGVERATANRPKAVGGPERFGMSMKGSRLFLDISLGSTLCQPCIGLDEKLFPPFCYLSYIPNWGDQLKQQMTFLDVGRNQISTTRAPYCIESGSMMIRSFGEFQDQGVHPGRRRDVRDNLPSGEKEQGRGTGHYLFP